MSEKMSSKKRKKPEPKLSLTPKGLFSILLNYDEALINSLMDGLELYMRRVFNKPGDYGAIIFDGKHFIFAPVENKPDTKK